MLQQQLPLFALLCLFAACLFVHGTFVFFAFDCFRFLCFVLLQSLRHISMPVAIAVTMRRKPTQPPTRKCGMQQTLWSWSCMDVWRAIDTFFFHLATACGVRSVVIHASTTTASRMRYRAICPAFVFWGVVLCCAVFYSVCVCCSVLFCVVLCSVRCLLFLR